VAYVYPGLQAGLATFAEQWAENIETQGWLAYARLVTENQEK
jgi:hypothetical protein